MLIFYCHSQILERSLSGMGKWLETLGGGGGGGGTTCGRWPAVCF